MKITGKIKAIRARCLECANNELDVKYCQLNGIDHKKCPLYPFRFGMTIKAAIKKYGKELVLGGYEKPYTVELGGSDKYPSKAVRAKCLECMSGATEVRICDCNGVASHLCPLYVYRLGRGLKEEECDSGAKRLPTPGVEY